MKVLNRPDVNIQKGDSYGKKYYPMVDDHGIEFNVIAENEKVTIAEAYIPFLYSKNLFYTTDYKERIMAYYTGEIEDILKEAGIADYIFQKSWIAINITEDYSLEDLATVIIALDDLLDYGYRNNTISRDSLGKNQYWDCIDWYDILIKQRGSDNKQLLYEAFLSKKGHSPEINFQESDPFRSHLHCRIFPEQLIISYYSS